ncbi:MAG TPA: hypothetical protein ENJ19_07220 [Gammaproteobacteria bacterium]|nr:hypothetical protein [Gammaproteobacteria bacterium]
MNHNKRLLLRAACGVPVAAFGLLSIVASGVDSSSSPDASLVPASTSGAVNYERAYGLVLLNALDTLDLVLNATIALKHNLELPGFAMDAAFLRPEFCDAGLALLAPIDTDGNLQPSAQDAFDINYDLDKRCDVNGVKGTLTRVGKVTATLSTTPTSERLNASLQATVRHKTLPDAQGNSREVSTTTGKLNVSYQAVSGAPGVYTATVSGNGVRVTDGTFEVVLDGVDFAVTHDSKATDDRGDDSLSVSDGGDPGSRVLSARTDSNTTTAFGTLTGDIDKALDSQGRHLLPTSGRFTMSHFNTPQYCVEGTLSGGSDPQNPSVILNVDELCDGSVEQTLTTTWDNLTGAS